MVDDALFDPELLVFNGLTPSGSYAIQPATPEEVAAWALGTGVPDYFDEQLSWTIEKEEEETRESFVELDLNDLRQAGWGVVFAANTPPDVREALQPLLERRHQQAGDLFKTFEYQPGESKDAFLRRYNMSPGPLAPEIVPYYLLIVGSPMDVPYNLFQYPLDVRYAVGRIHFAAAADYAEYVTRALRAEAMPRPRRMSFFAPSSPGDQATQLSARYLISPLYDKLRADTDDWTFDAIVGAEARKDRLARLFGGADAPSVLFTASHGMEFAADDPRLMAGQGAIVCGDWGGPGSGAVTPDMYFAGEDAAGADLDGLIAFHFACFSAGTPQKDEYTAASGRGTAARTLAPQAFMAALPTTMLKRGALAAVGHVERAWGCSFLWQGLREPQTRVFEQTLRRLLDGQPVGSAMREFNDRYSELAVSLQALQDRASTEESIDPDRDKELAFIWTANNDARSYVIVGDPAMTVAVGAAGDVPAGAADATRPIVVAQTAPPAPTTLPEMPVPAEAVQASVSGGRLIIQIGSQQAIIDARIQSVAADGSAQFLDPLESFGLFDGVKEARDKLTKAVEDFAQQVGDTLQAVIHDATTLTVQTYVVPPGTAITPEIEKTLTPRAYTEMSLDGDTKLVVPVDSGELDTRLWNIHLAMVQQAQSYRADMIDVLIRASAELVKALKG